MMQIALKKKTKKILGTVQIKEAGFIDDVNI